MAFFNRLFNRKNKPEYNSTFQHSSLRRSLTDPQPSTSSPARGQRSSNEDKDTIDILSGSVPVRVRARRAGCDFGRSKTSVDVGSVRSSASSAAEPVSSSADGSKSQYRTLRALHRSRLHTIVAALDRSNKRAVVLKTFAKSRMSSSLRAKLEAEVAHLRSLACVPGVVQFIQQFEDDDSIFIVLDRCPGPTLIELVANSGGRLSEKVLVPYVLIPLIFILVDLHRRGIVHRQIKPEHTLCQIEAGLVTLVDFSEAVNKNQRCLNNRSGSLEYMAPEVLNKPTAEEIFHQVLYNGMSEEELPQYDEKADVWSLGVLAFEALTGCQPFLADSPSEMSRLHRDLLTELDGAGNPLLFSGRSELSGEARSFLLQALQLDPINRSSAERLLQHPLLQRYWTRYQSTHHATHMRTVAASRGGGAPPITTTITPTTIATSAATGNGQVAAVAVAAAAAAAVSRTAGGGGSICAAPAVAREANLLMAAPLQFPVR
ncbi:hypothetical protein Vafri_7743 [Volvox africanus]|uniref:Protein kinase domain-containing protein n=1 Tax=Volvox africanus TaxID=51714 RepID=A0A8J4EYC5_9CHLO|nr:hypothetical protein Vafri_7743 [Volvox africanus]